MTEMKTEAVLEWDRILELLAREAHSTMGAERCRALPVEGEFGAAQARCQETAEMAALAERGETFPALSFPDPRQVLDRSMKGASLETHELRDVSTVLALAEQVATFLARRGTGMPALQQVAEPIAVGEALRALRAAIQRAVDEEGNIHEGATPELRRLSHHAQDLKQQMRRRLGVILESRRYADVLQEHYFAQREGRYVVPIKAEMRSRIPGIVHDVSASGATVFLEPRELVDLNNTLKVAELEVDREVRRILKELSVHVAAQAVAIGHVAEGLATLDCIAAKASFGQQIKGRSISLNARGRIVLWQARHPLLVLAREHVVPNDVIIEDATRVLVISGPNTGGKTVTLKMVGLFALMVRAGLQLPCTPDSEMAVFPDVLADIGDPQDLAKDLSSFSAHMMQIIGLLRKATPREAASGGSEFPRSLVLLDELVTSTDPMEGAALAEALLLEFSDLSMKVLVTTHYNALKVLAHASPGFQNASLEFDVATLSPTYRLIMGLPGGSSAIEIAGRLGMDERILEQARHRVHREDQMLERMLGDLQAQQRRVEQDRESARELRVEAERAAREAQELADRLRVTERDERKRIKKTLTDELLRARAQIQEVLESLKRERTVINARQAKQDVAAIEEEVRPRLSPSAEIVPIGQLSAGAAVEILGLGTTGTLLEPPHGKKRVRVRVGERELSVGTSQLTGAGRSGDVEPVRKTAGSTGRRPAVTFSDRPAQATAAVDLRGKTAEEALDCTVAALDEAVLAGTRAVRLIHGHGTGRLKAVLRDYLKASPYVAGYRAGERPEGGDGVTIVQLKD